MASVITSFCWRLRRIAEGRKIVKKLTVKSLATAGAFLVLLATSLSACGQPSQTSTNGAGSASQSSAQSGSDELQRWNSRISATQNGDELQRWHTKVPDAQEGDELQRWGAKSADAQP